MSDILFSSYDLAGTELPNRVVMAPMTRSRSIGNEPNELVATYYGQRAGAGLIITEGTSPSPNGLGYPRIPGIHSEAQTAAWREVTRAVHEEGGRIFLQLMHTGRVTHPDNLPEGGEVLAPSAVGLDETKMWVDERGEAVDIPEPTAMSEAQVEEAIEEYVTAARNATEAGFDGVELHGANGYLIEQFIHPHTNRRTDGWGGAVDARLRFAVEVARRVVAAVGAERVGFRISPYGVFNEMPLYDEIEEAYGKLATALGEIGIAYLHILDHSDQGAPEVPTALKRSLRDAFAGTVILCGGYDADRAEADLADDLADLIAFGRPFIANPDLVERMRTGAELAEGRTELFYSPGAEGYTDYPALETAPTGD